MDRTAHTSDTLPSPAAYAGQAGGAESGAKLAIFHLPYRSPERRGEDVAR